MMFKKLTIFMMTFIFIFFPILGTTIAKEEQGDIREAQILLLYDQNLSEEAKQNLADIADLLTYMGYSVSYSSIPKAIGQLDKFANIIIYNQNEPLEKAFLSELQQIEGNIMSVGNGISQELAKSMGLESSFETIDKSAIRLHYTFVEEKEVTILPGVVSMTLPKGDFDYRSGEVIFKDKSLDYAIRQGRFSNVALYDSQNVLLKEAFIQELALWMWPYNGLPHRYAQYIVFDKVYPFFDQSRMLETVDALYEAGVPYVIGVMPIYENTEYPAMKKFCEILRYAQTKGGTIILNAPLLQGEALISKEMGEKIETAYLAYSSYGVYPMALQAPSNWIYEEEGQKILRPFRTIFLTNSEESGWTTDMTHNAIYSDGHQLIAPPISASERSLGRFPFYSSAISLDMMSEKQELEGTIKEVKKSQVFLKSLWSMSHAIYTDHLAITYNNSILEAQGETVSLQYTPFEYEENFNYNRGAIGRFMKTVENSNRRLLAIVTLIAVIFILFIIIARIQNKKKFFH